MTTPIPDDIELHNRARIYAMTHGVSYEQAMSAVVLEAVRAQQSTIAQPSAAPVSDVQIDRAAKQYASTNSVSYSEALSVVASGMRSTQPASFAQASMAPLSDVQIDQAAKQYASTNSVSYSEALSVVAGGMRSTQPASFAQASMAPLSDVQIDQAAKQYARAHSVNYSEALSAVTGATVGFSELVCFSAVEWSSPITQMMEQQSIEVFRAGDHVDNQGVTRHFSEADLDGMATSYNAALREAPLTIGHPADNLPAYGWVKTVARNANGALTITPHQLEPQFAEMVSAGRFKKRSASFYTPQSPGNPMPGKWYLRHVAFLGAVAPAVAGLKDIAFS